MTEHKDTVVDDAATDVTTDSGAADDGAADSGAPTTDTTDSGAADTNAQTTDAADATSDIAGADSLAGGAIGADQDDTPTDAEDGTEERSEAAGDAEGGSGPGRRRATKVGDLEREGEVAADFLETLLDIADLDGDIDVDVDGDRAAVSIVDSEEGRAPRKLAGQDGTVLDALQELTRLAVQSSTGERSRLMLDVAGHRAQRRAALVEIARKAIEGVKSSGEQAALEPMTAFERKVVHDEVLAAGLASESDGVEPKRFVVILPT